MSRIVEGNNRGKRVPVTLSRYAAAVPSPISVNMFGLRFTIDCQKRAKNGHPPQSTTGVARRKAIPLLAPLDTASEIQSPPIARKRSGAESAALTQNRLRIESYSGS